MVCVEWVSGLPRVCVEWVSGLPRVCVEWVSGLPKVCVELGVCPAVCIALVIDMPMDLCEVT